MLKMNDCDRCGKCCIMFARQIHFRPDELIFLNKVTLESPIHNEILRIYLRIKDKYQNVVDGQKRFYIPIKRQISEDLKESELTLIPINSENQDECMFLVWREEGNSQISECIIHEFNPKMCKDYPTSKGGACLNKKELKISEHFFNYQKEKVSMQIKVMKEILGKRINNPIAYDVLTLLMDFGKFPKEDVCSFFIKRSNITKEEFNLILDNLHEHTLVFFAEDWIEGISSKEVEKTVDAIMKDLNWELPDKK
jgi:Fe-S-cluster containining protein